MLKRCVLLSQFPQTVHHVLLGLQEVEDLSLFKIKRGRPIGSILPPTRKCITTSKFLQYNFIYFLCIVHSSWIHQRLTRNTTGREMSSWHSWTKSSTTESLCIHGLRFKTLQGGLAIHQVVRREPRTITLTSCRHSRIDIFELFFTNNSIFKILK